MDYGKITKDVFRGKGVRHGRRDLQKDIGCLGGQRCSGCGGCGGGGLMASAGPHMVLVSDSLADRTGVGFLQLFVAAFAV